MLSKDAQPSSFFPKGLIMRTFINQLLAKRSSVVTVGSCFLAIALAILISPVICPRHNAQAAIDETMPPTIPDSIVADWKDQDSIFGADYSRAIDSIVNKLPAAFAEKYNTEKAGLSGEKLYLLACHFRRVSRMKKHEADLENIMFARHGNFNGFNIGYHDNSDAGQTAWSAGGALCVLKFENYYSTAKDLLAKTDVLIRDPCISFDGKKVLFAISGKGEGTGYKIYEMTISERATLKQLTFDEEGLSDNVFTVADFEPCYLPSGDIMFTSTRNFAMDAKSTNPAPNMFLMNAEGKFMRRVGFDQAQTFYPVLMDDGTVLYTRHEHNDRSLVNCMGLFTMSPDGAHQTEYFGNQTGWPFTMIHARPIPGTKGTKVICVAGGFRGPYAGELMIIDRNQGTNGTGSIRMIAPLRETKPDVTKTDVATGNVNFLFQNPCPLDENDFLVSWRKSEGVSDYRLYFMDVDGNRELIAWDSKSSVSQPVLIKPWNKMPPKIRVQANYNDSLGSFTMQDVYVGEGMKGIARGAAKTLRVVKLYYRAAGTNLGGISGQGPSGVYAPAVFCPVSAYGASWNAKEVLGEAKIYEDGSAAFKVPARTPVYFQVLDSMGYCIATMRSWSTLMPGENFACVGCHEDKINIPPPPPSNLAGIPKPLDIPLGIENKPFDYKQMVQPIFDSKCVKCHTANHESGFDLTGDLTGNTANKKWTTSYTSLLKGIGPKNSNDAINICTMFSEPEQQQPRSFGSSLSGIMTEGGMSGNHHEVAVTQTEKKIVACWIDLCAPHAGKYSSYFSAADSTACQAKLDKYKKWAAIEKENIKAFLAASVDKSIDQGSKKITRAIAERLSIGYAPTRHALVLKKISQGSFMLVDLRGKVISRVKISSHRMNGNVSIPLPASLSTGIYVARFEGDNGTSQTKISITK
jgi:hypothetical protein